MADLGMDFHPDEVPENDRFDPVPAGDYLCQIIDSDAVDTKAGDGRILKLTLEILEGPYEGRKIFENMNVQNPNPVAQRIAQRALADLCQAIDQGPLSKNTPTDVFHFRPFVARIAIETDKSGQYEPKNRVKRYKPRGGQPPAAKASPAATPAPNRAAAPPQQAAGNRPWKRQAAPNAA